MIFISVNTPTKSRGLGAGKASDLKWVELCARQIAKYAQGETIVVEKSTLPVKTAQTIKNILKSANEIKDCIKKILENFIYFLILNFLQREQLFLIYNTQIGFLLEGTIKKQLIPWLKFI